MREVIAYLPPQVLDTQTPNIKASPHIEREIIFQQLQDALEHLFSTQPILGWGLYESARILVYEDADVQIPKFYIEGRYYVIEKAPDEAYFEN